MAAHIATSVAVTQARSSATATAPPLHYPTSATSHPCRAAVLAHLDGLDGGAAGGEQRVQQQHVAGGDVGRQLLVDDVGAVAVPAAPTGSAGRVLQAFSGMRIRRGDRTGAWSGMGTTCGQDGCTAGGYGTFGLTSVRRTQAGLQLGGSRHGIDPVARAPRASFPALFCPRRREGLHVPPLLPVPHVHHPPPHLCTRIFPILMPLQHALSAPSMASPERMMDTPHSLRAKATPV